MKIALLSRGPSFSKTWRKIDPEYEGRTGAAAIDYQEIIGINDVPDFVPLDWWVFRDWVSFEKWEADVKTAGSTGEGKFPGIFTGQHVIEDFGIRRLFDYVERFSHMRKGARIIYDYELHIPTAFPMGPTPNKWSTWSGTAALGFAFCRMQKYRTPHDRDPAIDVYGVDLGGTSDAFGGVNTTRNADRWARESTTWDAMVEVIQSAGVKVNRIRPDS